MTQIDESTVRDVARLARLELEPEEARRLAREMEGILAHFDELESLDLEADGGPRARGLEPTTRADAPGADALAFGPDEMAPDWRNGFFVVPRLPALGGADGDGGDDGEGG